MAFIQWNKRKTQCCVSSDCVFILAQVTSIYFYPLPILDNEAPKIHGCPVAMTQHTDPGRATAVVTWTDPTAVDNIDPNPAISCTPVSGSEFVIGITEVVCEAGDANENTDMCRFTVAITGKACKIILSHAMITHFWAIVTNGGKNSSPMDLHLLVQLVK